jgi:hypothetical protein
VITARPPKIGPELCTVLPYPYPVEDEEGVGCAMVPRALRFLLPASGSRVVTVTVPRLNGTAGVLTVPYAAANDTALENTHYTFVDGNLVFGDGEDSASFDITLLSVIGDGDPAFVHFTIVWDNSPVVLCPDSATTTDVCLALASLAAIEPTCPYPVE